MAIVLLHQGAAARCAQLLQSEDATSRSTAAEALGRHSAVIWWHGGPPVPDVPFYCISVVQLNMYF